MTFYKRILYIFVILYINLSSSYFIKALAKAKPQDVDTLIQKLLDSDKFDELADKIAMKAAQRIRKYTEETENTFRSQVINETHRSVGPSKKGRHAHKTPLRDGQIHGSTPAALTSEEKKTTVISLKYKRFTTNIEDVEAAGIKDTTKKSDDEDENEVTYYTEETNSSPTTTPKEAESAKNLDKTFSSMKHPSPKKYYDDVGSVTMPKKKTTERLEKFGDSDSDIKEETNDGNKVTPDNSYKGYDDNDGDEDQRENKGSIKTAERTDLDSDEKAKRQKNKIGNGKKEKTGNVLRGGARGNNKHDDYEDNDSETKPGGGDTDPVTEYNKYYEEFKETEDRAVKDDGHADPEDEASSDSTEERLRNNKILVRREGKTLYAQNLDEYDDYRQQLEAAGEAHSGASA